METLVVGFVGGVLGSVVTLLIGMTYIKRKLFSMPPDFVELFKQPPENEEFPPGTMGRTDGLTDDMGG